METQIFLTMQKYNVLKNPLKETKILQDIITHINSTLKNPHIIIDLFLPGGQNPLSYYTKARPTKLEFM
jgi:hypothetical protein